MDYRRAEREGAINVLMDIIAIVAMMLNAVHHTGGLMLIGRNGRRNTMTEKAKGLVSKIEKKTSAAGKDYFFAHIGGVKFLFFDKKIEDCLDKEIEIEYTEKTDDKGTTFFGNFPGQAKTGGAPMKRGSSPEELKQKAIDMKLRTKTMCFSYAKDLVVSRISAHPSTPEEITAEMDVYIKYMLGLVAGNIRELEA